MVKGVGKTLRRHAFGSATPAKRKSESLSRKDQMPTYEYELCEGECTVCGGQFALRRPLSAAPLTHCPDCQKPVRKVFSTFTSPMKLKPLSISDAKKAGFTVLKRSGKGEYERQ
jgi:putative FmdB family regulatory protein